MLRTSVFAFLLVTRSSAQVTGLRLVSPRGAANEPAVISWDSSSTASYFIIEEKKDDGNFEVVSAVAGREQSAALWSSKACSVRVGIIGEDLLAVPDNFSDTLNICGTRSKASSSSADTCLTLDNIHLVSVSTVDTGLQMEWDVSSSDETSVSAYTIEMRSGLNWQKVVDVPAASIPGRAGCRSQAARVAHLTPETSYTFRVKTTINGKVITSKSVSAKTRSPSCSHSLLGEPLFNPNDAATEALFSADRVLAEARYLANASELNLVWLARVDGFLYNWDSALKLLAKGDAKFPDSFRVPRHTGHRMLGRRNVAEAATQLERARQHVQGVPATAEFFPAEVSGVPGVPKSSSQFNIYYHLGLSYFLAGNYTAAASVYEEGFKWAFTKYDEGDDAFIAMNYWLVNSYQRIQTPSALDASAKLLANVSSDRSNYHVVENLGWGYYYGLLLWKGEKTPEEVLSIAAKEPNLALDTYGYAVAQFLYAQDSQEEHRQARQLMCIIRADPMWSAFGYLGSEYDLFRSQAEQKAILV